MIMYGFLVFLYNLPSCFFFTEMAKRGCREFHIQDEKILELLMADNSDG